ncbi:MAG: YbaN family protein [Bdellovibrionota bacterium]
MIQKTKKYIFIFLGIFFLILGLIGAVLPLLPTTPFLILTAICFNQGSDKFHRWLMEHPLLSPPIKDWQERRAIRVKYKIMASTMMSISLYFIVFNERIPMAGKISVIGFLLIVNIYIWTRNSR